jgi:cytochrome P450
VLQAAKVERSLDPDDIELGDLDFWALPESEREGAFATLRERRPVSFHAEFEIAGFPKGPGFWAITRHEDVRAVSRDPQTFISGKGTQALDMPAFLSDLFGSMINMDDPRHGKFRRIVSHAFTPKRTQRLEAYVDEKAKVVVDELLAKDQRELDFVINVAAKLPLWIICEMMGIEPRYWPRVLDLTTKVLSGGDPEYAQHAHQFLTWAIELKEIGVETARERQKRPRDDIVSALVNANVDGEHLTPDELAAFFILLSSAGNETTRTAIAHGMYAFTQFPEQKRLLMSDFDRYMPSAVEEIIRWATPVISFRRTTTREVTLSGQRIAAGAKVLMFYNSANRDAAVFQNPFAFDVTREPNEHLGFGGGGTHFCLGAGLARRELSAMFRELFTRVPSLHIVGAPEILSSGFVHGIKRMPCAFTA